MSLKFEVDTSKFRISVKKIIPSANLREAQKKLFKVGAEIAHDIVEEAPTPPIEYGNLRGSLNIVVGKKSVLENPENVEIDSNHKIDPPEIDASDMRDLEVRVYMSMPYAEKMHELLVPEGPYQPGPLSAKAGNVGGGFIRKKTERADLQAKYNEIFMDGLF